VILEEKILSNFKKILTLVFSLLTVKENSKICRFLDFGFADDAIAAQ